MNDKDRQFVLCIKNDGCEDLEVRKIYEVLRDQKAAKDDYIRIINESGEASFKVEAFILSIKPDFECVDLFQESILSNT